MDNPFKFLRDPEWETLKSSATRQQHAEGATLLAAGTKPRGIMVIESGNVAVRRDSAGFDITVAELDAGAIVGEMSFIRDNPAFYGRFFESLAFLLSRRLREMTSAVGKQPADDWLNNET